MNRKQAIWDLIDEIQTATGLTGGPSTHDDVRTVGGDQDLDPPEIVLQVDAFRQPNYNGANNFGGFTTDSNGNQTGREFHRYYRITAECTVRSYDEEQKIDLVTSLQDHFALFEYDADDFHPDTAEWQVGNVTPRNNPVFEPDWYEELVVIEFVLLQKATQTGDTLTTIQQTDDDDMIDTSLEDGEIIIG